MIDTNTSIEEKRTKKRERKEMNEFKHYCNKVITFRLDVDRDIKEQFENFKKMCEMTSKNNHFKSNLSIDNYMVIMDKVIKN